MARRSARLASSSRTTRPSPDSSTLLSSVAERDDSTDDVLPKAVEESVPKTPGGASSPVKPPLSEMHPSKVHHSMAPPSSGPRLGFTDIKPVASPAPVPKTPGGASSPVKPPLSEMHPSKVHHTMGPPSSGLRLGFTDIKPVADRDSNLPAAVQETPTKIGMARDADFTFRSVRKTDSDMKLGPEAQRMMEKIREDASKYKAQIVAQREAEKLEEAEVGSRKIATAKGKSGRYSAAHMAEFKKMDSIANHPSLLRAQQGSITPLKQGIKRSQSKANIHEATPQKQGLKRSQSKADLDEPESARAKQPVPVSSVAKPTVRMIGQPASPIKRARQHIEDDASSNRPISRDGTGLPRPKSSGMGSGIPRSKSNLASLMTPTKSSLARFGAANTPAQGGLTKSVSKPALGGIPRSATMNNLPKTEPDMFSLPPSVGIRTPSRFDRVKAMLRGTRSSAAKAQSALPLPKGTSKTPAPPRLMKELPAVPLTTPGRKLTKRVAFTPETQRATLAQDSPSQARSGIPLSKSRAVLGEVYYPTLDAVLAEEMIDRGLAYPDLSGAKRSLPEPPVRDIKQPKFTGSSAPGTFTFRSDHTINFGSTSPSFGSSPGQASLRPVRPSIMPTENMPGSFPSSMINTTSPNKENEAPAPIFPAVPHGMKNKKRARASSDEEEAEQEAADRAAKKRKAENVPEGEALLAPRLMASVSAKKSLSSPRKLLSPGFAAGGPGTPSPKKRAMISLSRLNVLSRPKARK